MLRTFSITVESPDEIPLDDREVLEAMQNAVRSLVVKRHDAELPATHVAWTTKYRSLDEEERITLHQTRTRLKRATFVTGVRVGGAGHAPNRFG